MSHEQSNITITRKDMQSLRGLNWLNDEIMNVYVNLLQVRCTLGFGHVFGVTN